MRSGAARGMAAAWTGRHGVKWGTFVCRWAAAAAAVAAAASSARGWQRVALLLPVKVVGMTRLEWHEL